MRRSVLLAGLLVVSLIATVQPSLAASEPDDRVTPATAYVRHDGGTGPSSTARTHRRVPRRTPTRMTVTATRMTAAFRQGNEPVVAIDPTNPDLVFASWNDYCDTDLGGGWQGPPSPATVVSWTSSKIPGYPSDTSAEGVASPLHSRCCRSRRPAARLRQRRQPVRRGIAELVNSLVNGDVWVASANRPHLSGYPEGLPADGGGRAGDAWLQRHLLRQAVPGGRLTGGRFDGNVYICWSRFVGFNGRIKILFSRSTDSGQTFSNPVQPAGQGRRLRYRDRGGRRRVPDLGYAEHPVRDRRRGPGDRPIGQRWRVLPAGPSDRNFHPLPRPTARVTAATARLFARASSCSSACRWSLSHRRPERGGRPASTPPITRSTRPPWCRAPPPTARRGEFRPGRPVGGLRHPLGR